MENSLCISKESLELERLVGHSTFRGENSLREIRKARIHRKLDFSPAIPSAIVFVYRFGRDFRRNLQRNEQTSALPVFAMRIKKNEGKKSREYRKVTDRCGIPWILAALSCCSQETRSPRVNVDCISLSHSPCPSPFSSLSNTIDSLRPRWSKMKPIRARRRTHVASFAMKLANRYRSRRNEIMFCTIECHRPERPSDRPRSAVARAIDPDIDGFDRAISNR